MIASCCYSIHKTPLSRVATKVNSFEKWGFYYVNFLFLSLRKKKNSMNKQFFSNISKVVYLFLLPNIITKMPLGASVEVFNGRRKNEMSVKFPLPEGKERQGKHINKEDYRTHRLTGVQVSMTFSN